MTQQTRYKRRVFIWTGPRRETIAFEVLAVERFDWKTTLADVDLAIVVAVEVDMSSRILVVSILCAGIRVSLQIGDILESQQQYLWRDYPLNWSYAIDDGSGRI